LLYIAVSEWAPMRQTEKHLIQIFFSRSCVTVVRAYYINYLISVFFKVFSSKFFGFLWIISALSSGDTYFKSGFISLHWFLLFYKSIRQLPHLRPKQGMRATAFILHVILQHLLFPLLTFHQILLEKSNALVSSYIWLWCRVLQFGFLSIFLSFLSFSPTRLHWVSVVMAIRHYEFYWRIFAWNICG